MEVRNCRNCGRLFNYIGGSYKNLCPSCIDTVEEKFQQVKKYVEDNPGCTMDELTNTMEVSTRQVEKWIREDRLCFADDSPIGIDCEKCGMMIKSGRFCDGCRAAMTNQMSSLYKSANKKQGSVEVKKSSDSRMRYLDK